MLTLGHHSGISGQNPICVQIIIFDAWLSYDEVLKTAIEEISDKVNQAEDYTFKVRRDHILEDCFVNVSREDFSPSYNIKVCYLQCRMV